MPKNQGFKPFLDKGGLSYMSVVTLFFVAFFVFFPRPAHAGFFSALLRIFGGVSSAETVDTSPSGELSVPLMGSQTSLPTSVGGSVDEEIALVATQENALVSTRNPLGTIPRASTDQITIYRVESGDTPGGIAERFGISLQTLLWANNLRSAGTIKIGDDLIILPVTGVQYEVKKGDTLESIAKKFKGDATEITVFNGLAIGEVLTTGQVVIIPDGEFAPAPAFPSRPASGGSRVTGVPDYKGFYMRPIIGGRRSRGIHGYNGVDLANSCGMPTMASADGTVLIARTGGWNGGYGLYVVITHANKTQTLYAHLSSLAVKAGDLVTQGQTIGTLGSTGNSTGCHIHFEIRGAKNPF